MINIIGAHVIGGTSLALANGNAKPAIIKLVDPSIEYVREVRAQVGADCLIVIRWAQANQPLSSPLLDAANWFNSHADFIQAVKGKNVIFVGYNEIHDSSAIQYNLFEVERARYCHGIGANVGLLESSVGTPDLPTWATYQPALNSMLPGDYVCLHEYWSDNSDIDNRWHCCRWTMVPQLAGKAIAITECGRDYLDDTKQGKPGYKLTTNDDGFMVDLRKYSSLVAQYPNVRGATVFQVGSVDPQWAAFDVTTLWPRVVAEYQATTPITPPVTQPEPEPFAFDGRQMTKTEFKAHAESFNLAGTYDKVIMHHTAAPDEATWDKWGGWNYWKHTMRSVYMGYGWDAGPHCFVDQVGIGLFTPLSQDGIGVKGHNVRTRHIEIVGNFTNHLPQGARLVNAAFCAAVLLNAGGLTLDNLTYHRALNSDNECPGDALVAAWGWFMGLVNEQLIALKPQPLKEGLPSDETTTDPAILAEKIRYWSEESQRQYEAGNVAYANRIRLSNIQLCYRLENILKAA